MGCKQRNKGISDTEARNIMLSFPTQHPPPLHHQNRSVVGDKAEGEKAKGIPDKLEYGIKIQGRL